MANTIITKNSSTASSVPTAGDLVQGELAVNVTDKRLFTEDAGGNIVEIGTNPSTINIDAGTIDGTAIGGTTPTTGAFTTLSASTSVTSPSGLFTNLSASGSVTLSGGTANGVAYLNGSKVLTSGSALTFDGTNLGVGTSSPTNKLTVAGNANITGNTTLGDASTDTVTVNGYMGVGGSPLAYVGVRVAGSLSGNINQYAIAANATSSSGATGQMVGVITSPNTAAASFTVTDAIGVLAQSPSKGAGSTITNLHGVRIEDQTQGTNNYGITSLVSSGTNKWNIYASGTAANYFAGNVGICTNSLATDAQLTISDIDAPHIFFQRSGAGKFDSAIGMPSSADLVFYNGATATSVSGLTERLRLGGTEAVFNDPGNDYDFRVESDTNSHALFVQGSSGNVGIGTSSPSYPLSISSGGSVQLQLLAGTTASDSVLLFGDSGSATIGRITYAHADDSMKFQTNGSERLRIDSSGNLGLGVTPSAWATYKALQMGATTPFALDSSGAIGMNYYYDGAYKYFGSSNATLYSVAAGQHRWYTAPSGTAGNAISFTQAMTLDASGRLGVGLTSPVYKLQIGGEASPVLGIKSNTDTGQSIIAFGDNSANGVGSITYDHTGNYLAVSVNSAERARIDSSGNLLVGTTSGTNLARVYSYGVANSYPAFRAETGATTSQQQISFANPNGIVGTITTSGSATAYNTSSDYRLKNTVAPMTGALAKVAALKPVTYKWNSDGSDGEGFIAHELAEVVPQCVTGEKDAVDADGNPVYQGIDTSFLVATLTAAIQEQQAIIEDLKSRLTAAGL